MLTFFLTVERERSVSVGGIRGARFTLKVRATRTSPALLMGTRWQTAERTMSEAKTLFGELNWEITEEHAPIIYASAFVEIKNEHP